MDGLVTLRISASPRESGSRQLCESWSRRKVKGARGPGQMRNSQGEDPSSAKRGFDLDSSSMMPRIP
eukprot:6198575-Pleurochrysis_carterae.AAC.1